MKSSGAHQFGRARARQQIGVRVVGMAHADMAEGVDDAFVGDDAVGERELGADFCKLIGHGRFLSDWLGRFGVPHYRNNESCCNGCRRA